MVRAESDLQRRERTSVDVQPRHVGDRERAEERQPVPEGGADDGVDGFCRGDPVGDDGGGLAEQRELEAVGDEAWAVADDGRPLARARQQLRGAAPSPPARSARAG